MGHQNIKNPTKTLVGFGSQQGEGGKTSKNNKSPNLTKWKNITSKVLLSKKEVNICIIGKYVNLKDAYKSLDEALIHGGISNNLKVNLTRVDSENLKIHNIQSLLKNVSGIPAASI